MTQLPPLFCERLAEILPANQLQSVLKTFEQPRWTSFRVNTLKTDVDTVRAWLKAEDIKFQQFPELPLAFALPETTSREVTEWELYKEGAIYMQNFSSMIPPLILEPKPGELVLDLAAAPGSKTTQIAAMMECRGKLVANDKIYPRFKRLEANCKMQVGAEYVKTWGRQTDEIGSAGEFLELVNVPGQYLGKKLVEEFDRVQIDAPCSSEGGFCLLKPKTLGYWSRHKIKDMAKKQFGLLMAAVAACKPGGTILYSTCTFAPEENERVVDKVVKRCGGTVEIVGLGELADKLPTLMPGLTGWQDHEFLDELALTGRVLPNEVYEGFYVARLRKHT